MRPPRAGMEEEGTEEEKEEEKERFRESVEEREEEKEGVPPSVLFSSSVLSPSSDTPSSSLFKQLRGIMSASSERSTLWK
mmetsp:Transcript_27143/g.42239  ORF Transcript_27143/g.42239 Transcript_27143/m.42239 type:complete len:80 (+) Transcript_27143:146-385(+)